MKRKHKEADFKMFKCYQKWLIKLICKYYYNYPAKKRFKRKRIRVFMGSYRGRCVYAQPRFYSHAVLLNIRYPRYKYGT